MDGKRFLIIEIFFLGLLFLSPAYADTINLLNGNTIEGKITEQTDKYVKIETAGVSLTYYSDEIKSINRDNGGKSIGGIKMGKWSITLITGTGAVAGVSSEAMAKGMADLPPQMKEMMKAQMKQRGMDVTFDSQGMEITKTWEQCITSQLPYPSKGSQYCQETHDIVGNSVHYNKSCTVNSMSMEEAGDITYYGETMEGDTQTHMNMPNSSMNLPIGKNATVTSHITGKYLGPCS